MTHYHDRFKQNVDILTGYISESIIASYVEGTDRYIKAADADAKKKVQKEELEAFYVYIFIKKADQRMYGSLTRKWNAEFAQR